jgi:PncC family amidohydrolase
MTTQRQLDKAARLLAELLQQRRLRVVFAESCTGGLISAAMTKIPGISEFHCGSAVVYRVGTKQSWLGIPESLLDNPGPVSRVVAADMAERVLKNTPEADVAASVTGHLGPSAPKRQDGLIFVGIAKRKRQNRKAAAVIVHRHRLAAESPPASKLSARRLRNRRQLAAAEYVLTRLRTYLAGK